MISKTGNSLSITSALDLVNQLAGSVKLAKNLKACQLTK